MLLVKVLQWDTMNNTFNSKWSKRLVILLKRKWETPGHGGEKKLGCYPSWRKAAQIQSLYLLPKSLHFKINVKKKNETSSVVGHLAFQYIKQQLIKNIV